MSTPRRKANEPIERQGLTTPVGYTPARVLLLTTMGASGEIYAARLAGHVADFFHTQSAARTEELLQGGAFDVLMLDSDITGCLEFAAATVARFPDLAVVLLAHRPTTDSTVAALRAGVCDVVARDSADDQLVERLHSAHRKAAAARAKEDRIERLRRLCRRLNDAREQVTRSVGGLCTELATAYSEMSDKMNLVTTASEFNSIVRQELDIESLLRTVLEYLLTKTGPTNAAIFLPSSSGDFTLGAYVNLDHPKDSSEILLDHLAASLAPKFEEQQGIALLSGRDALRQKLGDAADWIGDSALAAFACRGDNECLAVVALFRDRRNPFPDSIVPVLTTLSTLFGKQLARVVHVHHRHLPPSKWGMAWDSPEPDDSSDGDLAA